MPGNREADTMGNARRATRPPRQRGRRGRKARTARAIEAKARERQEAYREGDRPNDTARLSADLNGPEHVLRPEGLFAEARRESAGQMAPGNPTTTGMYRT